MRDGEPSPGHSRGDRQGKGVLGVVDGFSPAGVESEKDVDERRSFLRKIGYKL